MSGALHFKRLNRGCEFTADVKSPTYPYPVHRLSMMDAAETLWNLWDEMRKDPIARGCIDQVHERRERERFNAAEKVKAKR